MLDNSYEKKSQNLSSESAQESSADSDHSHAVVRGVSEPPRFVAPTHGGVDILKLLTELEDQIEKTRRGPFGTLLRFDEDRFHMAIMKIRANLPEEMKRASKLARDNERIVEESKDTADKVLTDARKQATSDSEKSRADAQRLKQETQEQIDNMLRRADERAQQIVEEAEISAARGMEIARDRAEQLVAENAIVQQAQLAAQEMKFQTEEQAAELKRGSEDYAAEVLGNLESVLHKAVLQVQYGRDLLQQ